MSDNTFGISMTEAIQNAILDWIAANGGGFPIAFTAAVDYINAQGESMMTVAQMDNQLTHRSMGLAAYLSAWYDDDARHAWAEQAWGVMGGDDE